jgi:hypothetical protein
LIIEDHFLVLLHSRFVIFAVFASFAGTETSALDPALVALAVFLEAAALLAVAAFCVEPFFLDLWLKGIRISVYDGIHGGLAFFVVFYVGAVLAVAVGGAAEAEGEAVAVQLQTL